MDLTNEQAKALFDAGCFIIFTGLPEGTEVGIDGTSHIIRRFSGFKFVPPGFHSITWSLSYTTHHGGIPIRHAFLTYLKPKEKVILSFDSTTENVECASDSVISDDHLMSLDKELAPYPFEGLNGWKSLSGYITEETLSSVLNEQRIIDGLTPIIGEETEKGGEEEQQGDSRGVRFVDYKLRRSWRSGAIGEEVTKFSKDKSWLFTHVVKTQLNSDPFKLLAQLQLSFILLLHLSSYGGLTAFKRLLPLFTRSTSLYRDPQSYFDASSISWNQFFGAVILTIAAQLRAIPDGSFETELPEFDLYFLEEIEALRYDLASSPFAASLEASWKELQSVGQRWGWGITDLKPASAQSQDDEEESDEEGEYAPVVVDM